MPRAPWRAGEAHPLHKLTAAQVAAIRRRYAAGERVKDLAREHGVTPGTISSAVHYRTWQDGSGEG